MQPVTNMEMSPMSQAIAEEEARYEKLSKEVAELWKRVGPVKCEYADHPDDCCNYYEGSHSAYRGPPHRNSYVLISIINMKIQHAENPLALSEHRLILLKQQHCTQKLGI